MWCEVHEHGSVQGQSDNLWKPVKGSDDAKDIEYEHNREQFLPIRAAARILFEDIAKCKQDKHGQTKRARVLEKLDELRDALVVLDEVVGEMKEIRKIVHG